MNKKVSKALVATLVLGTMVPATFASAASFTDINNSYAKDAITRLAELGVINGKDDTHFDPQGAVTRAEFVKILVRSLNLPTSTHSASFTDTQGHWASNFIETAIEAGIIQGVGDGLFDPNGIVNREQAATMLVRALQTKGLESNGTSTNFADFDQISDWAKPFIELAQQYNLVKGDGVNFNPRQNATREQAVILTENILKALDQLKKEYKITPENVTMNVGESKEFKVNGGGTYNTVAWSVSGNGTIDQNGKFTATSVGTATISALIDGAKTVTTSVTVNAAVVIPGGGGSGGGGSQEPPVESPETKLMNPSLTIYALNVEKEWIGYPDNTVFQVNVNFASGTTSENFTSAEISLFNGNTKLATNTAKKALLDLKSVGLTDLFGIGDTENTKDDPNWNIGAYPSNLPPTKVKFTLKDKNGVLHVVEAPITTVQKPAAPDVTADDENNTIVGLTTDMEFKVEGSSYVKYDGTNAPNLSGTHTIKVRYAATPSMPFGLAKTLTYTDVTANTTQELQAALGNESVKSIGLPTGNITGSFDINRDVTIVGQGDSTVIHAIDTTNTVPMNTFQATSAHSSIFKVSNTGNVKIKNLVIDGEGKGSQHPDFMGIDFENAGGELDGVKVINIKDGQQINGAQEGIGIYAENTDSTPRKVTVTGTTVSDYQKGGMIFKGDGLTVDVQGNTVKGAGKTNIIAQNGIQLSKGASGTVKGNTVTGHHYDGKDWGSTGILLWGAGESFVSDNKFEDNDTNVYEDISSKLQAPTLKMGANQRGLITGVIAKDNETLAMNSSDPTVVEIDKATPFALTAKKVGTAEIAITLTDKTDPLLVREGYITVTVNPADVVPIQSNLTTTDKTGVHGDKVYQQFNLMDGTTPISLASDNVSSITVTKPNNITTTLTPDTDSSLWFNVQNDAGDYKYTVVGKDGKIYKSTLKWVGIEKADTTLVNDSDLNYAGYKFIKNGQEVNLATFDAMDAIYEIKPYETKQLKAFGDPDNFMWFNKGKPAGTYTFLVKHGDVWTQAVIVREI